MTMYKYLQTDGSGNWFLHLFALLFRVRCTSHIHRSCEYSGLNLNCTLTRFHKPKHYDANAGTRWCYGDEFGDWSFLHD